MALQCAKKPGASGFCAHVHIGLVNSVRNLPYGLGSEEFWGTQIRKGL